MCFAEEGFIYPEEMGRDPFEALVNSDGVVNLRLVRQEGDLKLNGIIYSDKPEERTAIINNEMLKEYDYIGAYKIESISSSEVVLIKKDKKIVLKMGGSDEK